MIEIYEYCLKWMKMWFMCWGIKEMDIILSYYVDYKLVGMDVVVLDLYDVLLYENDQDLYQWVSG